MDLSKAEWRKARRSTDNGGNCVEVAAAPNIVVIRNSKHPVGGILLVGRAEFRRFAYALKNL
ncbi:DUF397 domain-containing protein [Spirillospora sp. NPDC127200]